MLAKPTLLVLAVGLLLATGLAWKHLSPTPLSAAAPAELQAPNPAPLPPPRSANSAAATTDPHSTKLIRQFPVLKERAELGDVKSQRLLADVYDACRTAKADPADFLERHATTPFLSAENTDELSLALAHARVDDCSVVDEGGFPTWQLIREWYAKAADKGDLAARIRDLAAEYSVGPPLDADEANQLLEDVIASQDPAAIYAYGEKTGGPLTRNIGKDRSFLVEDRSADRVWRLAACRMGYDCSPQSMMYSNLCLQEGACAYGDYEQVLRSGGMTEAERNQLEPRTQALLKLLQGTL
ncbi:hypothetical protein [Stenotrophomonas sp. PS02289]|uniref:hypothetical protein n=1 Tax=Stenotrophomonas sp. PS02289 TaxID=2991422 RepID=UPI00249BC3BA|nr:hypothetical protein [Stenotrophomonas sp. PS02289]